MLGVTQDSVEISLIGIGTKKLVFNERDLYGYFQRSSTLLLRCLLDKQVNQTCTTQLDDSVRKHVFFLSLKDMLSVSRIRAR